MRLQELLKTFQTGVYGTRVRYGNTTLKTTTGTRASLRQVIVPRSLQDPLLDASLDERKVDSSSPIRLQSLGISLVLPLHHHSFIHLSHPCPTLVFSRGQIQFHVHTPCTVLFGGCKALRCIHGSEKRMSINYLYQHQLRAQHLHLCISCIEGGEEVREKINKKSCSASHSLPFHHQMTTVCRCKVQCVILFCWIFCEKGPITTTFHPYQSPPAFPPSHFWQMACTVDQQ